MHRRLGGSYPLDFQISQPHRRQITPWLVPSKFPYLLSHIKTWLQLHSILISSPLRRNGDFYSGRHCMLFDYQAPVLGVGFCSFILNYAFAFVFLAIPQRASFSTNANSRVQISVAAKSFSYRTLFLAQTSISFLKIPCIWVYFYWLLLLRLNF